MIRRMLVVVAVLVSLAWPAAAAAQTCEFRLGFKVLHDQIPEIVGDCIEDEHLDPWGNSSALQQTTKGLLVWRGHDNWTAFTNGETTWINGPCGLQSRPNAGRFPWEQFDAGCVTAAELTDTPFIAGLDGDWLVRTGRSGDWPCEVEHPEGGVYVARCWLNFRNPANLEDYFVSGVGIDQNRVFRVTGVYVAEYATEYALRRGTNFLANVAEVPYDGADPAAAGAWVELNASRVDRYRSVETTIGSATLILTGEVNARRLRLVPAGT
jgi:hypothetical protein